MGIIIARIIGLIATIGIGAGINYLALPAWDLRNPALWGFLLGVLAIGTVIQLVIDFFEDESFVGGKVGGVAIAVVLVVLLIGGLTSWQLFSARSYGQMITIEDGNFEEDINQIQNIENISIVDMQTAERLGDRTIGSIKNAAWYEVDDEYNLINFNGEQYRISSLNYGGYFKSQKAKYDGIPGYVAVNTSTQDAKFEEFEKAIKYSPSAHWSFDLKRHLRNQYPSYMLGKHYFEVDEEGNPYYITAVNKATIGMFGGKKESSFIITNASTGESKEYKPEELPEWVDHAYSLEYLMRVARYNLSYVNGFWNAHFSKTNVLNTTYEYRKSADSETGEPEFAGYNTAITANGDIVFYTGLTPASNAESNVGFILANPRTGVITRYTCSGAEESSAQASAESLVQDLKYEATFPTILNVDGEETYFMLLKDKAGLVQRYALCNLANYTKVVQADSLQEAVNQYLNKLGKEEPKEVVENQKTEGTIKELYEAQIDGCTFYYFKLEGSDNLYMSSIKNSNKQVMLKVGTKVSIEYVPTAEKDILSVKKINF